MEVGEICPHAVIKKKNKPVVAWETTTGFRGGEGRNFIIRRLWGTVRMTSNTTLAKSSWLEKNSFFLNFFPPWSLQLKHLRIYRCCVQISLYSTPAFGIHFTYRHNVALHESNFPENYVRH